MQKNYTVDSAETLERKIAEVREAQAKFATYSQEQVDEIFKAAALAANQQRIPLAQMAVEETGMGVVEDKVIKNHYAAEYIYNAYKNAKTCGVIEEDKAFGVKKIAEPLGLIAAVIPTTNPTSTAIFKTLISLKTRNGIIISPHPRAKASTIAAAKVVLDAAVAAGAPKNIIGWIDVPSLELTNEVMRSADIILAPALRQLNTLDTILRQNHPQLLTINRAIAEATEESHKISTLRANGLLDADICAARMNAISARLAQLRGERRRLTENEAIDETMDALRKVEQTLLNGPERLDGFDEELFERLVEKIIAESQNRIRFRLYGGLELTEQWEVAAR